MSQILQSTEGIILKTIPFKDYDQILYLFTLDAGLMKVIDKGGRSKRHRRQRTPFMPLTRVELVYSERQGEIFNCHEMNCIESFLSLRGNLSSLEAACDLLQVILKSQFLGKAAPQLYILLCFYLKKIAEIVNPSILTTSFRLKLLRHDGLSSFPFVCSECTQLLSAEAFSIDSETWCIYHKPAKSLAWDLTDLEVIYHLANCQSYREICLVDVSPCLQDKVNLFFDTCIER